MFSPPFQHKITVVVCLNCGSRTLHEVLLRIETFPSGSSVFASPPFVFVALSFPLTLVSVPLYCNLSVER
eukprot:m.106159 g.106159  ORF g.106159 m.106159 type:complete len:70 (-) comp13294_c0_seq2:375-584(-)